MALPRAAGALRVALAAALPGLVVLTGCAGLAAGGGQGYRQPPLPVPASYPNEAATAAPAVPGWRSHFSDPALQALIATALRNNRDLRLALLRTGQARAALGLQAAESWPTLALQAGSDRSRVPADLNPFRQAVIASQLQAGLGLASWEIDFWGRVASLRDAALHAYLATEQAQQAAAASLVAQVADGWLGLRELDERLAIARRTVASRQHTLRITSRRVEVGATSQLNLTQVQTLALQAETLALQLQQARAAQVQALQLLVGQPLADDGAGPLVDELVMAALPPGLPSALLVQRPDIVAAEQQLRAADAGIGAARAAFFPRITLTAALGTASAELSGLFEPGSGSWRLAPALALPLLDGGRNRANLSLAELRRDEAVARYDKAVQAAFHDVAVALDARQRLAEQLAVQQQALAVQRQRARLAQLRFDHGAAAFLDVLDAQRELLAAEQAVVQLRRALLSSRVRLYAALGGGSFE